MSWRNEYARLVNLLRTSPDPIRPLVPQPSAPPTPHSKISIPVREVDAQLPAARAHLHASGDACELTTRDQTEPILATRETPAPSLTVLRIPCCLVEKHYQSHSLKLYKFAFGILPRDIWVYRKDDYVTWGPCSQESLEGEFLVPRQYIIRMH